MKREDIEKAAGEYSGSILGFRHNLAVMDKHKAFSDGAEWRIGSVWHKPCDIAEPGKDCLVEHMDGDGNVCICIDWRSEYEWVNACHYDKILRWAYIEDLTPNTKNKIFLNSKYEGELHIGDKTLPCAVLDNGTRILTATSVFEAFDRPRKGKSSESYRADQMPSFINANNLQRFVDEDLIKWTKLINYMKSQNFLFQMKRKST